jgi:hypothetical protein
MRVLLALAFLMLISMCSATSPFSPYKTPAINAKNARPAGFRSKDFNVWSSLTSDQQEEVDKEVNPLLDSMDTIPEDAKDNKIWRYEAELVHSDIDGFDEIDLLGKDDPNIDEGNDWLGIKELRLAAVAKLIADGNPEFIEANLLGKIRRRRKL